MSIVAFKKKSVIQFGTHVSGRQPGGTWLTQGPFGKLQQIAQYGPVGFSLNGGHRNRGAVGTPMAMSQNGTRFRGIYPYGIGKFENPNRQGMIPQSFPVMNVTDTVEVPGTQFEYIKPSVLSTPGMLAKRYRWIRGGQYPAWVVKDMYTNGALSDNRSQGVYVRNVSACNAKRIRPCVSDQCSKEHKVIGNQGTMTEGEYALYHSRQCRAVHFPKAGNGNGSPCYAGCANSQHVQPSLENLLNDAA